MKKTSGWPIVVAVVTFLIPVLYVASIGPALWLDQEYGIEPVAINSFYAPVIFGVERSPPWVKYAYYRYLKFWGMQ